MTKLKRRQTYPKEDTETLRDTIRKLKSQIRKLQKTIRELKAENKTLSEAWSKTEEFLGEITEGKPLKEILKYKTLPKKVSRKNIETKEDKKQEILEKWQKWNKENKK